MDEAREFLGGLDEHLLLGLAVLAHEGRLVVGLHIVIKANRDVLGNRELCRLDESGRIWKNRRRCGGGGCLRLGDDSRGGGGRRPFCRGWRVVNCGKNRGGGRSRNRGRSRDRGAKPLAERVKALILKFYIFRERLDNLSCMLLENLVDKHIRFFNLFKASSARDNYGTCVKGTNGDFLALAQRAAVPISRADTVPTRTNAFGRGRWRGLVVEVFRIASLVNRALKRAEQVVAANQDFVELLAINEAVNLIVAVNELNTVALGLRCAVQHRRREQGQLIGEPCEGFLCKGVRGNARHLDTPILEQLDIDFLVNGLACGGGSVAAAHHESGLIKEDVLRFLALGELIAGAGPNNNFLLGLRPRLGLLELGGGGVRFGE